MPAPIMPRDSWFVGCGNMGGAMVRGWQKAGVDLSGLTAISPSGRDIPGIQVSREIPDGEAAWCFLGFKPQKFADIAPSLAPHVGPRTVIFSLLAGTETVSLRAAFPKARAIVRLMPNLPVSEGEGVTALYSPDADGELRDRIQTLHEALGYAPWCSSDDELVLTSTIAGSGPAYVARFVSAFAKAGAKAGLKPDLAFRLALETIAGTGLMARRTGEEMNKLARRVASPGGTTEAGLCVLDDEDGIDALIERVVDAARQRSDELAKAARG